MLFFNKKVETEKVKKVEEKGVIDLISPRWD